MGKRDGQVKVVYVGEGMLFVRQADGRLVKVPVKRMSVEQRVFTSRVVGRD